MKQNNGTDLLTQATERRARRGAFLVVSVAFLVAPLLGIGSAMVFSNLPQARADGAKVVSLAEMHMILTETANNAISNVDPDAEWDFGE